MTFAAAKPHRGQTTAGVVRFAIDRSCGVRCRQGLEGYNSLFYSGFPQKCSNLSHMVEVVARIHPGRVVDRLPAALLMDPVSATFYWG